MTVGRTVAAVLAVALVGAAVIGFVLARNYAPLEWAGGGVRGPELVARSTAGA